MYQKHDVHENPRKTQKVDITRKVAFWATKVPPKTTFLGVEKMGLTTSNNIKTTSDLDAILISNRHLVVPAVHVQCNCIFCREFSSIY